MARDIRERALQKIALLSAATSSPSFDRSDLDRLCRACHASAKSREYASAGQKDNSPGSLERVPMPIREFEVLLALCKVAPRVLSSQGTQRLSYQLIPYMVEAHAQTFALSPSFRKIAVSPTEALAFNVTAALLALGINDRNLQDVVNESFWAFLNASGRAAATLLSPEVGDTKNLPLGDAVQTATIAVSLLGFLQAASAQAEFWKASNRVGLIEKVKKILSESFLIAVETSLSTIRNAHSSDPEVKDWKRYLRKYASSGRPLGAMLLQRSFMWLVVSSTSLLIADANSLRNDHILDLLMARGRDLRRSCNQFSPDDSSVQVCATIAIEQMSYLEAGADFVRLGTAYQQKLAFEVKSAAMISFLNCASVNDELANPETLMGWLQETLDDPIQMADETLALVVLRCLVLICRLSPDFSPAVSRLLPRYLVQTVPPADTVAAASKSLASVLKMLSEDAVISTLYAIGNVLSSNAEHPLTNGQANGSVHDGAFRSPTHRDRPSTGSSRSLQTSVEEDTLAIYGNIVQAICGIAVACEDEKITALAQSMLLQKLGKIHSSVDLNIVMGTASLALSSGQLEFRSLLKGYSRLCHNAVVDRNDTMLTAISKARTQISANMTRDCSLFEIYWEYLLESIISLGDNQTSGHNKEADMELAAREIAELLHPLAVLLATNDLAAQPMMNDEANSLLRDAWFNIVVHGFTTTTSRGKKHIEDLRLIAVHSPPLVSESRSEQVESDIELNTVLRQGNSNERESMQKKLLSDLIPSKAHDIKGISYRKTVFLQGAYLMESLRADAGDCTKALCYFLEPCMRKGDVASIMEGITASVVDRYIKKTLGGEIIFSARYVAVQLASIFCSCCHRIERVQQAAFTSADRIIRDIPSALCSRKSLFALLELLSLMWTSCLEAETELYAPRSLFTSELGGVSAQLSDDYDFRRSTLVTLHKRAKGWVNAAINLAPLDVKGLLQTYLSEYPDEGAYGHISLGRSFALELGSVIPSTNQRLQSLNKDGNFDINTASDLIAQYTTRQEYRYGDTLPARGGELINFMTLNRRGSFETSYLTESANAATALAHVEARILSKKETSLIEIRHILRRAAALLCRSDNAESAVAHYLVSIPFALFNKQSIKLGVSLWLGVMNENPKLEPKLLNEIAQQWEFSINRKVGLFSPALNHPDPFCLREEFAPSDLEMLAKKKQIVHDVLSPHSRLLQFFNSHFNATRFSSPDIQRVFLRMLTMTLEAVKQVATHPMTRELRFQIILFGLRVIRCTTTIEATAQWRLKNSILAAGLSWFRSSPRWSFGSNVLQIKTEVRLILDVLAAMKLVSFIGAHPVGNIKSLQSKEQLLTLLLENEQSRLEVWVNPLQKGPFIDSHNTSKTMEGSLLPHVRTAWWHDPALAIELATRFHSPRLHKEVRFLLLSMPERALSEPEALSLLFGGLLANDIHSQLKYLLFWKPVNPITAVTFFLPAYMDNAFVVQYAMRSLDSHSIDVTFFYVPQIVQTLRYDRLGYVNRYIFEAAQLSQLFAHQIIWNMKANSYKDDDAQVPDAIKPTLDGVMDKIINSFSSVDKDFFEREFAFFDEITGISGKLKPLIERPKPEKKQKIEEELRKIKLEVGVYLPSNPDGVVIGIDRKSGKPLQSHAKAPYMATFRIKKSVGGLEGLDGMLEDENRDGQVARGEKTIEVWQSAIFKVGDDCRQDVLVLQMMAAFRGIFHDVGLDVYLYPNRVTATAPGCGVIDVLPNSISRDMLGREAVNGLYDYFVSKYGNEDSLRFQQARNNFVKSMAGYSVISFLLQFKDRHNGNIMIDDAGHILHIDFGFCFDIAPGGIKFERAPFKLTSEMVAVMGGSRDHQSFKWFEELCVKAFLASRPYCEKLSQLVLLMMDSGLPCFKPESVKHFKERFVLEKNERDAADFMRYLIKESYKSHTTGIYDQFQLLTNGIPY